MIKLIELGDTESIKAIETGEYSQEIISSAPQVIIILTQSWCPDWWVQKKVLKDMADNENVKVFFLEYNKKNYKREFTIFKETAFGNGLIPYLRFYRNGQFEKDSNYAGKREIEKWLEN